MSEHQHSWYYNASYVGFYNEQLFLVFECSATDTCPEKKVVQIDAIGCEFYNEI